MKIEEIENELKIPHEGYCNLNRNLLLKLMAVAKAAKAYVMQTHGALCGARECRACSEFEEALEALEKE